jgi:replication factor A1
MIRGEEKQIAFGTIEDMPWAEGEGDRWDYKDWGQNQNLSPGAIVRLEGVSVNEYQGKMSLNINQSSRIVVLQEGSREVVNPSEPVEISTIKGEGMVTVVGRVLASREDVIHRKDGSGTLDVVRGRVGDDSGVIGFLSWEPFTHEVGSLIKIQHAQVRSFRNTPELNIGRSTKVEVYRDTNFASLDDLSILTVSKIEDLTDGNRDVECVVEVQNILVRTFSKEDGEEGKVWSGEVADPTGRCRMSCWQEPPFTEADLPVIVKITGARVRAWQGIPDITVDSAEQIELLDSPPWEKDLDLSENVVEVELNTLTSGASRVGISTVGTIVSVRDDSGLIRRCSDCKRVLREGACVTHGEQEGVEDVRLRMVLDDGSATLSLIVNRDACLALLSSTEDEIKDRIIADGQAVFVQSLRERMLGRRLTAIGRTIVDEQGAMLLAESCTLEVVDTVLLAAELRQHWGVA